MLIVLLSDVWQTVLYLFLGLVVGGAAGFFISRYYFKRELEKNPPINEKMIRAMFKSMGRTASETQIRQVMNSMNKNK